MQLVPIPSLINGHSYEWSDIQLSIAGAAPIFGITSIEYASKRASKNVYGAGSQPVSRGYGAVEYTGAITIKMEEITPLRAIAPFGDITQIPNFTIVVSFLDAENVIVVNTLNNVHFLTDDFQSKQGDTSVDFKVDLLVGSINY